MVLCAIESDSLQAAFLRNTKFLIAVALVCSEYKQLWEGNPFLRAGGDLKSSTRPKENFCEFFAREHALLAVEREAYIKGRNTGLFTSRTTAHSFDVQHGG